MGCRALNGAGIEGDLKQRRSDTGSRVQQRESEWGSPRAYVTGSGPTDCSTPDGRRSRTLATSRSWWNRSLRLPGISPLAPAMIELANRPLGRRMAAAHRFEPDRGNGHREQAWEYVTSGKSVVLGRQEWRNNRGRRSCLVRRTWMERQLANGG